MTSREWRAQGFAVLYRDGVIYLVHPETRAIVSTDIRGGQWMRHDDLTSAPWRTEDPHNDRVRDFARVVAWCYCNSLPGTPCDFCTHRRPLPEGWPERAA